MNCNNKICKTTLISSALVLFLILVPSTSTASADQNSSIASFAYVTVSGDNAVSVIDTATNNVAQTVNLGTYSYPFGVAVSPDGTKVYVANCSASGNGTVSIIDTTTNKVTSTVKVGSWPAGVVISPDGTRIYVANSGDVINNGFFEDGTVSIIDTTTNNVTARWM